LEALTDHQRLDFAWWAATQPIPVLDGVDWGQSNLDPSAADDTAERAVGWMT